MSNTTTKLEVVETIPMGAMDVAVSPVDGKSWAARGDYLLWVYGGGKALDADTTGDGRGIRYSPDGSIIHVGNSIYDAGTGKIARVPAGPRAFGGPGLPHLGSTQVMGYVENVGAACFEPTTTVVAARWTRPRDGSIKGERIVPGVRLLAFNEQVRQVADFTPDLPMAGDGLLAVDCSKRWVVATAPNAIVWDRTNGYKRVTPADAKMPAGAAIAIRPDDTVFAVAGTTLEPEGTVTIVDPATSAVITRGDAGVGAIWSLAFSLDGTRVAVGGTTGVAVLTFDGKSLQPLASADVKGPITGVAFEPDGNGLRAVGGGARRLVLR